VVGDLEYILACLYCCYSIGFFANCNNRALRFEPQSFLGLFFFIHTINSNFLLVMYETGNGMKKRDMDTARIWFHDYLLFFSLSDFSLFG